MRVTTIDHFRPEPGTLLRWSVDSSAAPSTHSAAPPSFNQGFHLDAALSSSDGAGTWLATAFDVEGTVDLKAIHQAYLALIARHGTLQSSFESDPASPRGVQRRLYDPAALRLHAERPVVLRTSHEAQTALWAALNASCRPVGPPGFLLAAIDRVDRSTVVCGFDHTHVDGYSMSIVVDDLRRLYAGFCSEPGGFDPLGLPRVGSFVDYCAAEHDEQRDFAEHPLMARWTEFFAARDNTPPAFPFDLGLAPGENAPQAVDLRRLADARLSEAFASRCAAAGASTFAGVLSAMSLAARDMGGGDELAMLFPMHTRRARRWESALGWFTTNAPVTIAAHDDFASTAAAAGPSVRDAVALGAVPIAQVSDAVGGLRFPRGDVFMVSYIDYRRLPGAERHRAVNAHHISGVTRADDVQVWISRDDEGLWLRTRHPATATARECVEDFLARVQRICQYA